ncbi:HAMP domain-containing sensor histidine kinase [Streptomyces sp. NPDC089799]|uniref:sensor histidine kinase n=1 Tax=Streptomyces sp. NPDC089799 TaxID=3155066 RepID=UPI003422BCE4
MAPRLRPRSRAVARRRRRTLARELVLFGAFVALVAVLLSGVTAWYTARGNAEAQERDRLGRQATVLSRIPRLSAVLVEGEQLIAGANGVEPAVLEPSGTLRGPAAPAVSNAQRDLLLARKPLSATGTLNGREVIIEGRAHLAGGVILTKSTAEVDEAAARIRRNLVLPLCAGLLGAGLAGLLLARRIARPLTRAAVLAGRLAAGERGITESGRPDGSGGPGGSGESGESGQSGVSGAGGPAGQGAGPDPSAGPGPLEVAEVTRALAVLDRELTRAEGRRRDFLLSVSHEIRTPLTTLRGYAEALADGVIPAERVPEIGGVLGAEAQRLDGFLRDLLDLARLEADSGDFRITPTDTDLSDLVTRAAASWRERCARHGVEFRLEETESGTPVVVRTDSFRVRQLLDCLLENALRVTPAGRPVVLALAAPPAGGGARLQVRDGGPGLTGEDVEVAFERGALHDRYRGERPGGSGLGLAIAHRLATRLGGTLTVLGRGPEGGAAFTLDLPAAHP